MFAVFSWAFGLRLSRGEEVFRGGVRTVNDRLSAATLPKIIKKRRSRFIAAALIWVFTN